MLQEDRVKSACLDSNSASLEVIKTHLHAFHFRKVELTSFFPLLLNGLNQSKKTPIYPQSLPRTRVRAIDIAPHYHFSSLVFLGTLFKAGRALWCQLYCWRKSRLYEITSCKRDSVSLAPSTLMDGLRTDDIRGFRHPLFKRGVDVVFLKRDLKGIEVFEVCTKFCFWDILCVMCVRRSKRINPNKS